MKTTEEIEEWFSVDESACSDANVSSKDDSEFSVKGNHFADSVKMNDLIISLLECTQAAKERRQAMRNASALTTCLALQRDSINCIRSMMGMTSKQHPFTLERSLSQVATGELPSSSINSYPRRLRNLVGLYRQPIDASECKLPTFTSEKSTQTLARSEAKFLEPTLPRYTKKPSQLLDAGKCGLQRVVLCEQLQNLANDHGNLESFTISELKELRTCLFSALYKVETSVGHEDSVQAA